MANAFTSVPSQQIVARTTNAFHPSQPDNTPAVEAPPQQSNEMYTQNSSGTPTMPAGTMPMMSSRTVVATGYQSAGSGTADAVDALRVQQMMGALKDSLYPSQREWAAEGLAALNWRTHSEVVDALVTAAREDPAATVRAGCVHALAKMGANTVPVVSTIQGLKTDRDPRVRHEVDQALTTLTPNSSVGGH
jgi:hypothetical protein